MSTKSEAADGIRRFMRSLRTLEEVLDTSGNLERAADEAQVRLDRLKSEEAEFLAAREKKEQEIIDKAAAKVATLKSDEEDLLETQKALTVARGNLQTLDRTIAERRLELEAIEDRLADLRKMIVRG